eukprot:11321546-Ditylum_brightwellii.AAC.1
MTGSKFIEAKYKGIYRDDGLTVGKWDKVNGLTGGDYLQFTTEIWNPTNKMTLTVEEEAECSSLSKETRKKVKEHTGEWFPFLDMKMKWENEQLLFRVYRKRKSAA